MGNECCKGGGSSSASTSKPLTTENSIRPTIIQYPVHPNNHPTPIVRMIDNNGAVVVGLPKETPNAARRPSNQNLLQNAPKPKKNLPASRKSDSGISWRKNFCNPYFLCFRWSFANCDVSLRI